MCDCGISTAQRITSMHYLPRPRMLKPTFSCLTRLVTSESLLAVAHEMGGSTPEKVLDISNNNLRTIVLYCFRHTEKTMIKKNSYGLASALAHSPSLKFL